MGGLKAFGLEFPPRDPAYETLTVECEFLLRSGRMASGFVQLDEDDWQAWEQVPGGYRKCDAVKWRAKQRERTENHGL